MLFKQGNQNTTCVHWMGNRDSFPLGPTDTIPKEKLERPCFYWVEEEQLRAWFHWHHPDRGIQHYQLLVLCRGWKIASLLRSPDTSQRGNQRITCMWQARWKIKSLHGSTTLPGGRNRSKDTLSHGIGRGYVEYQHLAYPTETTACVCMRVWPFHWCLAEVRWVFPKRVSVVRLPFP